MIQLQTQRFKMDLKSIAQSIMQHMIDPDLGPPRGANVRIDDPFGLITIYWTGRGKTFDVTQIVPPRKWQAAKTLGETDRFISECVAGMRAELMRIKRNVADGYVVDRSGENHRY